MVMGVKVDICGKRVIRNRQNIERVKDFVRVIRNVIKKSFNYNVKNLVVYMLIILLNVERI